MVFAGLNPGHGVLGFHLENPVEEPERLLDAALLRESGGHAPLTGKVVGVEGHRVAEKGLGAQVVSGSPVEGAEQKRELGRIWTLLPCLQTKVDRFRRVPSLGRGSDRLEILASASGGRAAARRRFSALGSSTAAQHRCDRREEEPYGEPLQGGLSDRRVAGCSRS